MTVVLIAHYLGPALGIGQYINRLVPDLVADLQQRGVDALVLASPNAAANSPALGELGPVLQVLPQLDYPAPLRYFWFASSFPAWCRKHAVDGVAWLSNPIVFPWHPPSIAVLHDVNEWKNLDKGRLRTRLRALVYLDASLRFARKIVAISAATRDDIQLYRPGISDSGKVETILNGMDSTLASEPRVDVPAPEAPFLLSVGRIDPLGKRLSEAVEFVRALRDAGQGDWELHLVGGMNESTAQRGREFLDGIAELPWVRYHGHVSNAALAEWYRRCDAVIFLSRDEGFGLPVAEAACFGQPVVVNADNKASLEVGGSCIHAVTLDNLAAGAAEFLASPRTAGAELETQERPSWRAAAHRYGELLEEVCAPSG